MTQDEFLAKVRKFNPGNRYAKSKDGWCIGEYNDALGRFRVIVHGLLSNPHEWVYADKELLINGNIPYKPEDWLE